MSKIFEKHIFSFLPNYSVDSDKAGTYYALIQLLHRVSKSVGVGKILTELSNRSDGLMVKSLDSQSKGSVFKTTGWLQG